MEQQQKVVIVVIVVIVLIVMCNVNNSSNTSNSNVSRKIKEGPGGRNRVVGISLWLLAIWNACMT